MENRNKQDEIKASLAIFKENLLNNYADIKGSAKTFYSEASQKISRISNITYLIFTLIAYIVYGATMIYKYGIDNWLSILFLSAMIVYTIILIACLCFASTIKQGNDRFKVAWKVFSYFKYATYAVGGIISIIALIAVFNTETNGWIIAVSIFSLISNFIRISFSIFMITIKSGTGAVIGAFKHYKKKYNARKENQQPENDEIIIDAPTEESMQDRMK